MYIFVYIFICIYIYYIYIFTIYLVVLYETAALYKYLCIFKLYFCKIIVKATI